MSPSAAAKQILRASLFVSSSLSASYLASQYYYKGTGNFSSSLYADDDGTMKTRQRNSHHLGDADDIAEQEASHALSQKQIHLQYGLHNDALPTYSLQDVKQHTTPENGIWVTYRNGVYDITDFVREHPGGYDKIRLAFGASVDPFWQIYGQHRVKHVLDLLESFRIGNLASEDASKVKENLGDDVYASDPERHPALVVRSEKPFNAETPREFLGEEDSYITPNSMFYVRNHFPVPQVKEEEYRLRVSGNGIEHPQEFTLEELRTLFPKKEVTSTVQCAGNRREEMNKNSDKKVRGLVWDIGAIGNAKWAGAPLKDVLEYCGLKDPEAAHVEHVWFEGLDVDADRGAYGASIPVEKAVDARGDVILAYEMNGEQLPADHGYPIRAICPGIVGARNVKWVGRVVTSQEESPSHWQRKDYKGFGPNKTLETINWEASPSIQDLPVQSAIAYPQDGTKINPYAQDSLKVTGYSYAGGGRNVVRVDVSVDGGKTWRQADLKKPEKMPRNRDWSWTPWEFSVDIPEGAQGMEIIAKATDSGYNVQPETTPPIWNARGVLSNAWHRVNVEIDNTESEDEDEL